MPVFKEVVDQGDPVLLLHGAGASYLGVMPMVNGLAANYSEF